MPAVLGSLTLLLVVILVLVRVAMLRRRGIEAMNFGKLDKKDFLIPPFVLFYFYLVFAHAFGWPSPAHMQLFYSTALAWVGVAFSIVGLGLFIASLVAFGESFRVGIDTGRPDKLITSGVFGLTRNPLYLAMWFIFMGQFLVFPHWVLLLYLAGAVWLVNRQVLREEGFLKIHYGQEYVDYCRKVRRYI